MLVLASLVIATSGCGSGTATVTSESRSTTSVSIGPSSPSTSSTSTSGSSTTSTSSTTESPTTLESSTTTTAAEQDYGSVLVGKTFKDGDAFVRFERRDDGDLVAWREACNTSGSSVAVLEARLDVGSEVVGTAVGCPPDDEAADDALTGLMEADPQWSLTDRRLTLRSGAESRTFEEA